MLYDILYRLAALGACIFATSPSVRFRSQTCGLCRAALLVTLVTASSARAAAMLTESVGANTKHSTQARFIFILLSLMCFGDITLNSNGPERLLGRTFGADLAGT